MKSFFPIFILFIITLLVPNELLAQHQISSGYDVIRAMYDKYEGKWYQKLEFRQNTTFYGQDGKVQRTQIWHEALEMPGKLAIKFDDKESNNGILFNDGVQYGYANGKMIQELNRVHELLVLGFDVYHQAPDVTATQLAGTGFDIEKVYEDEWQGRPVYVIGTDKPDSTVRQFWIDKERLYFVRNITIGRNNTIQEVQFNKYEQLGGGWIAPEVIFYANGFKGLLEEYSQIVVPDSINEAIFAPETFITAEWM